MEEKHGEWLPCSALQCSLCNGIVTTELGDLDHGENDEGEMEYECPHCGAANVF
jgi:DNA-directed RNA polymerase subunit RPC12/RpoP